MFKIGEFSRLSRVSVRMLRHYEQLGLLKPSKTDPFTNYRFYTADQLPRLNRILALRDLGFSLEQIGGLLDENLPASELMTMFKLKREEIEAQVLRERLRLERMEARIRGLDEAGAAAQFDVVLREIKPQLVASLRQVARDDDHIQAMFEQVEYFVAAQNARADLPPQTIYHDREYREMNLDAEVAVPLKFEISGTNEVQVRQLEHIPQAACVVHTGSYASIYQAYNALLDWIQPNGYCMSGPIREVYLRYGAEGLGFDLPPTFLSKGQCPYVTELQLSVEREK